MTVPDFLALVVIALAAYRVTRVVVADTLSDNFRAWMWARAYDRIHDYDSVGDRDDRIERRSWWWAKGFELVSCPFCTGFWASLVLYLAWFDWHVSFARPAITALAVAGLQAFISSRAGS